MRKSYLLPLVPSFTNPVKQRWISTCRHYSNWKTFSLDEDLTLEVKQSIEKKWATRVYGESCPAELSKEKVGSKANKYILSMFPYPSGKLHLGHLRVYTLSDVLARFHRLKGFRVVHPMGWDAFGLPAENAARDHGLEPRKWTVDNIGTMRNQIIKMGCCFDWDRELLTCDPSYYRWTQWLFLKLYENGLAYRKRAYVFWDPVDQTVLAEEQVDSEMRSWRSGAKVEKKLLRQWFIRTAVFAEQLTSGLNSRDLYHGWRDIVKLQKHWIGPIQGYFSDCSVNVGDASLKNSENNPSQETLRTWFTSSDTMQKAKFCILRSDHFLVNMNDCILTTFSNGVKQMNFSIQNPATGKFLPVFAGPAEIMPLVPASVDCRLDECLNEEVFTHLAANESFISELNSIYNKTEATVVTTEMNNNVSFKFYPASLTLRDWLVSRQRKWGTPIPFLHCTKCCHTEADSFSHLSSSTIDSSSITKCSNCGSSSLIRDTDTLDTFFDSSWYFFRYLDPKEESFIFDPKKVNSHLPVDIYVGGKEHATLHLYYARFMTQFLNQLGLVEVKEPFRKLIPVGVVMGETYVGSKSGQYFKRDEIEQNEKKLIAKSNGENVTKKWEKMSKSKYNGTDPELVINEYGIDTTRLLVMAEIVPTSTRKWPTDHLNAFMKWQGRVWLTLREFTDAKDFGDLLSADDEEWQKTESELFDARNYHLKGITNNYENSSNISVVISKIQGLIASIRKIPAKYWKDSLQLERALGTAIICMYPIMPAFGSQMWQQFRVVASCTEAEFDLCNEVWEQKWPEVDYNYNLDLICRVNGQEVAVAKVERQILDSLDQTVAFELAFEQPKLASLIPRESGEIESFTIHPGYQAVLNIRAIHGTQIQDKRADSSVNPIS